MTKAAVTGADTGTGDLGAAPASGDPAAEDPAGTEPAGERPAGTRGPAGEGFVIELLDRGDVRTRQVPHVDVVPEPSAVPGGVLGPR